MFASCLAFHGVQWPFAAAEEVDPEAEDEQNRRRNSHDSSAGKQEPFYPIEIHDSKHL